MMENLIFAYGALAFMFAMAAIVFWVHARLIKKLHKEMELLMESMKNTMLHIIELNNNLEGDE